MYNGPALINDEEVTVSGGVVTLTHSDVLRIDGLKKFTDYRIRERNIPNYETYISTNGLTPFLSTTRETNGRISQDEQHVEYINKNLEKVTIPVSKVLAWQTWH